MARSPTAWGRLPTLRSAAERVRTLRWRHDPLPIEPGEMVLAHGLGRSYGDSCLNEGGVLLDTTPLDHLIAFDANRGVLECEAGVTLEALLDFAVPRGWFPPVVPGTKFVTVGGAIANDVHGKNHHRAGTFGRHIVQLRLRRSTGELVECSPTENGELFSATIGGLGLTGLIVSARLQLTRIPSPFLLTERIRFQHLDEFFSLSDASDAAYSHTVAWIDTSARGQAQGRGILIRGNHAAQPSGLPDGRRRLPLSVPLDLPELTLNRLSLTLFNRLYFALKARRPGPGLEHYEPFFFPLDSITNWNRLYGRRGFFQYQCVVAQRERGALKKVLDIVAESGELPFLSVMKVFGSIPSPGMMSFPRHGPTLALDFPNRGRRTYDLFDRLDQVVIAAGGAIYPAKDARMSGDAFRRSFPQWQRFSGFVDPDFSSSFWRRVNG